MILEVIKYGHPVLRQKGAPIEKITPEIKRLIADMFETMHERHGVGLAAQQVGKALQLTVIDVREIQDRPSTLELMGKAAEPNEIMPLVLINPEIKPVGEPVAASVVTSLSVILLQRIIGFLHELQNPPCYLTNELIMG